MLSGLISWLDKFSLVQVLFVVDISDMLHVGSESGIWLWV